MRVVRWLRSFSPDLCAEQMYKLTFTFANDINAKANEYGLGENFSFINAVSAASFAVNKAFMRDIELPEREELALVEYKKAVIFQLYLLHKAGKLKLNGKNFARNEDFVDWCQKYLRDNFEQYAKCGDLNDAGLPGPANVSFTIVKSMLDQINTQDVEKAGKFIVLASMYYGDFYKLCKVRLG